MPVNEQMNWKVWRSINQIKEWQHNENKTQRQTLIYKTQKTKDPAKRDTLKTGGALGPPEG